MQDKIIPFGKYKGQPIEVLRNDQQYAEWLSTQDWFVSRYSQINNVIINNFTEPSETPEHNRLTARFLDETFQLATILASYNVTEQGVLRTDVSRSEIDIAFEGDTGSDVIMRYQIYLKDKKEYVLPNINKLPIMLSIECKPNIGDDYPAIIRQCRAQKSNVIVYESFTSKAITEDNFQKMFKDIKMLSVDKILKFVNHLEGV